MADPSNADALSRIDSALFVVCLDDSDVTAQEQISHNLLHNWGANRYVWMGINWEGVLARR